MRGSGDPSGTRVSSLWLLPFSRSLAVKVGEEDEETGEERDGDDDADGALECLCGDGVERGAYIGLLDEHTVVDVGPAKLHPKDTRQS